jgi:hypothetical protein
MPVYVAVNDDLTRVRYHAERLGRALPRTDRVVVDRDAPHEVMHREIVGHFNRMLRPVGATRLDRRASVFAGSAERS